MTVSPTFVIEAEEFWYCVAIKFDRSTRNVNKHVNIVGILKHEFPPSPIRASFSFPRLNDSPKLKRTNPRHHKYVAPPRHSSPPPLCDNFSNNSRRMYHVCLTRADENSAGYNIVSYNSRQESETGARDREKRVTR